jgi:hypothetical protein
MFTNYIARVHTNFALKEELVLFFGFYRMVYFSRGGLELYSVTDLWKIVNNSLKTPACFVNYQSTLNIGEWAYKRC